MTIITPPSWSLVTASTQQEVDKLVDAYQRGGQQIAVYLHSQRERITMENFIKYPGCVCGKPHFDWLIVSGGERPLHPTWVRTLRDQCREAVVPFAFLGWGEWYPSSHYDEDTGLPQMTGKEEIYFSKSGRITKCASPFEHGCPCDHAPGEESMVRLGTARSSRLLDGREHLECPEGGRIEP